MALDTVQNNRLADGDKLENLPDVQAAEATKFLKGDGTWETPLGGGDMLASSNLSDVANQQTSLNNVTNVVAATDEYVLTKDTTTGNALWKVGGGAFLSLSDTPSSYSGQTGKVATVNGAEDALEFTAVGTGDLVAANNLSDVANASTSRTNLGLAIGSDVQAFSANNALTTDKLSDFAATTSAELITVISDETGSGALVFATSPTLVTPALGTPASGVATNLTGTAAGLTAGAVSTITGLAPDTATTQATQAAITSAANLATVGTITTGVWTGTDIAVPDGGTGRGTATAYAVLCGGTTSTGAHQSIAGLGTSGQVLTSNGAAALPTFQAAGAGDLISTNNLSDVANAATSLSNLGGIGAATTDTLTNKTFDANGTGNSLSNVDVADLANGTDGELITWDAAGAPATVAVGTVTHVLTSNGVGAAPTFQAASGGGAFSTTSNVTSNTPGTLATDDFVFGSDQLDDDGDTTHDARFMFDKSLGSFFAGKALSTEWDVGNRGTNCFNFGTRNTVSGNDSFATGDLIIASGLRTRVFGTSITSSGDDSASFGENFRNALDNNLAVGFGTGTTDDAGVAIRLEADPDQNDSKKASIFLRQTTAPSTTTDRLYNVGGALTFNGVTLGSGGDVTKVGTPVDNQVGVWTGDGTIEGTSGLTYDGSNLLLTGDIGITGTRITKGWFTDLEVTNDILGDIIGSATSATSSEVLSKGINQSTHGFVVGDIIYEGGSDYVKAQADAVGTLGEFVVTGVQDTNNFTLSKSGIVTATSHGFTVDTIYYTSPTVAGTPTVTEPTDDSQFSNPMFKPIDANTLHILNYRPSRIGADVDTTNTGTSTSHATTPDGIAGSYAGTKSWVIALHESDTDSEVADGKVGFVVPASMNGMNIVEAVASVHTAGTTGTTDYQLRRRRATSDVDAFSTKLTIDSGETSSTTAATPVVINTSNDDLQTGDILYVDTDAVSTTAAKGDSVVLSARLP